MANCQESNRGLFLPCFGEHFWVPPKWLHISSIASQPNVKLVIYIQSMFSGHSFSSSRTQQNLLGFDCTNAPDKDIAIVFGTPPQILVIWKWYIWDCILHYCIYSQNSSHNEIFIISWLELLHTNGHWLASTLDTLLKHSTEYLQAWLLMITAHHNWVAHKLGEEKRSK